VAMKKLIENFRKLPAPLIILHVFSKALFGFGLGILLSDYLKYCAIWIIVAGVLLSIPSAYKIFFAK
jgi:hypothetical protein